MCQEKNKNKTKAQKTSSQGSVCQKHLDNCGHVEHRISIPLLCELIRYCFLTRLKHFNRCTVYSTKCSLFICKYLFIYLFGLWFWMHIYAYILYSMLLSLMWRLYCYSNLAKIYFSVLSLSWVCVFFVFFLGLSLFFVKGIMFHLMPFFCHKPR